MKTENRKSIAMLSIVLSFVLILVVTSSCTSNNNQGTNTNTNANTGSNAQQMLTKAQVINKAESAMQSASVFQINYTKGTSVKSQENNNPMASLLMMGSGNSSVIGYLDLADDVYDINMTTTILGMKIEARTVFINNTEYAYGTSFLGTSNWVKTKANQSDIESIKEITSSLRSNLDFAKMLESQTTMTSDNNNYYLNVKLDSDATINEIIAAIVNNETSDSLIPISPAQSIMASDPLASGNNSNATEYIKKLYSGTISGDMKLAIDKKTFMLNSVSSDITTNMSKLYKNMANVMQSGNSSGSDMSMIGNDTIGNNTIINYKINIKMSGYGVKQKVVLPPKALNASFENLSNEYDFSMNYTGGNFSYNFSINSSMN